MSSILDRMISSILASVASRIAENILLLIAFRKNLNASKPSEHPPQVEEECLKV